MKYYIIIFICFISKMSFSQTPAVVSRSSDVVVASDGGLITRNTLRPPVFSDTTAANSSLYLLDSCGRLIFTYNDNSYWMRSCSPKRWMRLLREGDVNVLSNNGLSKSGDTTQLGGPLTKNTTITGGAFGVTLTASGAANPLSITSSGTSNGIFVNSFPGTGSAINAQSNNATVISAFAFGTGYGGSFTSTSNIGMYAATTSGVAGLAVDVNPSSTNTSQTILQLKRYTSGTAANNIAGRIEFITEPASGTVDVTSGYIESGWEDATFATRKSFMGLYTVLNGASSNVLNLSSAGQLSLPLYPTLTAQVDSTTYKPIAIDNSGNVVKMAGWVGTGGGLNQLIGDVTAGPGTGSQVATIANSAVTTAKIADLNVTNAKIDTFYTYPAPSVIGTIWYDSAIANIADYLPSGGPAISLTSGVIAVTNATAADAAQVAIKKYRATNLHNWTFRTQCRSISQVVGFGPGLMSIYSGDNSGFHFYVSTTSTGFFMRSAVSGTTLASGTGPTINDNDIIEFVITRTDSVITGNVRNVTTSSAWHTISKTYTAVSGGTLIPNDGYWHFVSFADDFNIISHEFSSTEVKTPTGLILGDSKSDGYYTGTFAQRYWVNLNSAYPSVVLNAGQNNKLSGVYNKIDELYALNPEWVVMIDLGRNDIAAGMTLAQFQVMFADIYTKLSRNGQTRVYICMMPEDTTAGGSTVGLTPFHQWLAATYPNDYISAVWDDLSTANVLDAAYNSGDNIHLNAAGNAVVAAALIASGKLTTISPKRRTPYIANDGFITFTGNTLHAAFDAQRVPNYVWRSDTANNLVPSIAHDDGSTVTISTNYSAHVSSGVANTKLMVDGMAWVSGVAGSWNIKDRTTSDYFSNIAQGGIYQLLTNGTPKWYLDVNGLMAVGTNPAITGRSRGIFNIWEDRSFANNQLTKGLGFNLDSNTYTQGSATTLDKINNASIFPIQLLGTGSTTYTNPASLYIEGSPYAGASTTVISPWSLNINSGNVRLGTIDSVATATGGMLYRDAITGKVGITKGSNLAVTTSSAGTLTLGNSEVYIFDGTTTTWTLPAVSGTNGRIYYIKNIGSGSITLNADSGNNEIYSSSAVNTITVTAGSAIILISNNTYWTVN